MEWNQTWTIISVNVGLIAAFGALVIYNAVRHDSEVSKIVSRIDGHAAIIDQLYGIIVDMLKKKNKDENV